jgi:hypothetical protein
LYFSSCVWHAPPISSIGSPEWYLVSTYHGALHYAVFSSLVLLPPPLYLPQRPAPEHSLPVLFPKCKKSSLSPTQNKKTRSAFYKQQNCMFELLVVSPYLTCYVSLLYLGGYGLGCKNMALGLLSRMTHIMIWECMK